MTAIPNTVLCDGMQWRVVRVWPAEKQGCPAELRSAGQIRGAFWNGQSFDVCAENSDPRLPALADVVCHSDGVLVSHRPGKRAVVRGKQGEFIKVVRPGRTAPILLAVARSAPFAETFRTPTVLAHDDSTVTFSPVEGHSLHRGAGWNLYDWTRAWAQILHSWGEAILEDPGDAPLHDAAKEAAVLTAWAGKVTDDAQLLQIRGAAEAAVGELATLPETRVTIIHRDLHDKQLLWDANEGPGLIDLDTVSSGDPSIDLGNLWAHAILRQHQELWDKYQASIVRELIVRASERANAINYEAYARATLVRLACIYSFRPAWRHLTPHLLKEAQQL
ncbi:MAG: phosphotransferase [Ancrocorticia sp.]